jgi:hypothetical protein
MKQHLRTLPALLLVVGALACSDAENPFDSLGGPDEIETNTTNPEALLESHSRALNERDFGAYMALLDPAFRFYIRDDDADDFPWLPESYWEYDVEEDILANMMDPDFAGGEPAVETIEASFRILSENVLGGGERELTVDAALTVLVGPNSGWAASPRFVMILAKTDDFFRIRSIHEVERLSPGSPAAETAAEEASWGRIKALYRTRPAAVRLLGEEGR